MTKHERPILFLDIDGVLTPTTIVIPRGYGEVTVGETTVVVHRQHGAWLRELAAEFEVVWATSWEAQANEIYCPALDFGTRQYVEFPRPHGVVGWKLPRIREVARDRAIAWIDDEITTDEQQWADGRSAPTRLVATKSSIGMTREHVDDLLDWAQTLRHPPMSGFEWLLVAFYAALFAGATWLGIEMWDSDVDRWGEGFPTYPQLGITTFVVGGMLIRPRAAWDWAIKFAAAFALVPAVVLMVVFMGLCGKYGCNEHAGGLVFGMIVILGGVIFGRVLVGKLVVMIGTSLARSVGARRRLQR